MLENFLSMEGGEFATIIIARSVKSEQQKR